MGAHVSAFGAPGVCAFQFARALVNFVFELGAGGGASSREAAQKVF